VVAGAGFGVAYAVRRGWIGPLGRVAGTAALGAVALAVSERARRRAWNAPAQALAAGSVALFYLAAWSSARVFGLVPLPAALVVLTLIAALAAGLAVRHDSQPLAVLALAAGLLNPFTTGAMTGPGTLAYVVLVTAGALALMDWKDWPVVERTAFAGSWLTALATGPGAGPVQLVMASALFVLFAARPFQWASAPERRRRSELVQAVANGFLFLAFVETALALRHPGWQGAGAFALGATYVALWGIARARRPGDDSLPRLFRGLAVAMATIGLVFRLDGFALANAWAAEGVLLLWLARRNGRPEGRLAGVGLVGLSFLMTIVLGFSLGAAYSPDRLVLTRVSLQVAVQVAALAATARLLGGVREGWERAVRDVALVTANLVALGWATLEARAEVLRSTVPGTPREQALAFAASAVWAGYAACAYAVGMVWRSRRARLAAAALFGVTVLKMVLADVWLLGPGLRMVVFTGVGALLIVCSLGYHRYRARLADVDPTASAS
jgi:uncharacterized membrane protein